MSKNTKRTGVVPVHVSQNFLTSSVIINRLIRLTSLNENDEVIEIGAGKGHITNALIKSCKRVTSYEIDSKLCRKLKEKFSGKDNLVLHQQDFLTAGLPSYGAYKIFANIPFCITTKIIQKLMDSGNPPSEAWLVMEKGAAKRFCGTMKESTISLSLKPIFEMKIIYHFRREDFHPKPSVDTVLLYLQQKPTWDVPKGQVSEYRRFIKQCMSDGGFRRFFTKKQLSTMLPRDGYTTGDTLYIQWLCLFRQYKQKG